MWISIYITRRSAAQTSDPGKEAQTMAGTRGAHKVERVTITLVPGGDERSVIQVPSTFDRLERTYGWRRTENLEYMIVPTRISNTEVKLDFFFSAQRKGKQQLRSALKVVEDFVREKIGSEWKGLSFGSIGRPTFATPPTKSFVRGTIEEMLGANLDQ
jgi:hypothetical protein